VLDYLRRNDTFVILQLNRLALPVKQLMGLLVMLARRGVAFQSLDDLKSIRPPPKVK
jgi:DNA invertase Pin-like site-specific DNA recombinase